MSRMIRDLSRAAGLCVALAINGCADTSAEHAAITGTNAGTVPDAKGEPTAVAGLGAAAQSGASGMGAPASATGVAGSVAGGSAAGSSGAQNVAGVLGSQAPAGRGGRAGAGAGAGVGGVGASDVVGGTAGVIAAGRGDADPDAGTRSESVCPLPSRFAWRSSGVLAEPKPGWVSLKDFTYVLHEGKHIIYMTTHDTGTKWGSAMFTFDDWSDAASAPQLAMTTTTVAPTLLYFAPKDIWVLAYQWGGPAFSYATSSDPADPGSWSFGKTLYNGSISGSGTGPIDQSLICDDERCFLFFAGDNGSIYRSSLPIAEFPGTFPQARTILTESQNALFEAVEVYSVKGAQQYLMIVEAIGSQGRFFRAFTSNALDGDFVAMPEAASEATPFAGKRNVTFDASAWTNDISHGDLIRTSDQTKTVDPCNLQLLYQGRSPSSGGDYGRLPYRPGLLTLVVQ